MDPNTIRSFIEETILEEAKPILNLRYLDMEKYRKYVLISLDKFLEKHNIPQNNTVILTIKKDEIENDKIDVSVCGDIKTETTKKSAYITIKGKQFHWSDAALMDTSKLMRLGRRYNREHPTHKIPSHKRKSNSDVIHHIWNISID
jgi:hypothetical protein